jgi:hypothetical protein
MTIYSGQVTQETVALRYKRVAIPSRQTVIFTFDIILGGSQVENHCCPKGVSMPKNIEIQHFRNSSKKHHFKSKIFLVNLVMLQ